MNISQKILAGFIIVSLVGILGNLMTFVKTGNIALSAQSIAQIESVKQRNDKINANLELQRRLATEYLTRPDPETYGFFVESGNKFTAFIAAFRTEAALSDSEALGYINRLVSAQNNFINQFNHAQYLSVDIDRTRAIRETQYAADKVAQISLNLSLHLNERADIQLARVSHATRAISKMVIALLAFTCFITIAFCVYIERSFMLPFRRLKYGIRAIGQGKFDEIADLQAEDEEVQMLIEAFQDMARELRRYRDNLIETERMKAIHSLATGVSHEVNNPLTIISGTAEYIRSVKGCADSDLKEKMTIIIDEVQRISDITRKLTHIQRLIVDDYTLTQSATAEDRSLVNFTDSAEKKKP
ncbi:MAG: histidine kinase dimerization/phospho-acceptor domain-containing protein [Fibrobacterota bacterium]